MEKKSRRLAIGNVSVPDGRSTAQSVLDHSGRIQNSIVPSPNGKPAGGAISTTER